MHTHGHMGRREHVCGQLSLSPHLGNPHQATLIRQSSSGKHDESTRLLTHGFGSEQGAYLDREEARLEGDACRRALDEEAPCGLGELETGEHPRALFIE